jgi:hypothetical protein
MHATDIRPLPFLLPAQAAQRIHAYPTPRDIKRIRHVRSVVEFGAVLQDVEQRLGRPLRLADLEEVVTGHHGRGAIQRKTATYVRQLPGWGGAGALYQLSPGLETTTGEVAQYAVCIEHAPEPCVVRNGRPGETTVSLHPATECGATWGEARFVGYRNTWHADSIWMAWAALDYDAVTPKSAAEREPDVANDVRLSGTLPQVVA